MTGRVVWLPPGTYSVSTGVTQQQADMTRSPLEPRPGATWTIREILADLRGEPVSTDSGREKARLQLFRTAGGNTVMASLGGVLYVSLVREGLTPNIWDHRRAEALGFALMQ